MRWPRLSEPIHDAPDWGPALDLGLLVSDWRKPGWICGCVGPGTAWGEVGLQTMPEEPWFYIGVLLDHIQLDPGERREFERAFVRYNDLFNGYRFWAEEYVREMTPRPRIPKAPLVGYCSWYQLGADVSGEQVQKETRRETCGGCDTACGWQYPFASHCVYEGLDELGVSLAHEAWQFYTVEKARAPWTQEECIRPCAEGGSLII